jgi:hypothetical protein
MVFKNKLKKNSISFEQVKKFVLPVKLRELLLKTAFYQVNRPIS